MKMRIKREVENMNNYVNFEAENCNDKSWNVIIKTLEIIFLASVFSMVPTIIWLFSLAMLTLGLYSKTISNLIIFRHIHSVNLRTESISTRMRQGLN